MSQLGNQVLSDNELFGFLVAREPFIFWGPEWPGAIGGAATLLAPHVGNRRAYFLVRTIWSRETRAAAEKTAANFAALRTQYPEHRHIVLCNTRGELALLDGVGVPAILCSTLAFVDETQFDILPDEPKQFDAVYNAALVPFKRHALCIGIPSLALIYHRYHPDRMSEPGYERRLRALLPQATFVNELGGEYRLLDAPEVARWHNRARVGLCLSEAEGAMRAAVEYLLCGLPVVSTPSVGGRDRVLDPAWSRIVDATPAAVAGAVVDMIRRNIDPRRIRAGAFDRLRPDRVRLLNLIRTIYEQEGLRFPAEAAWEQVFRRGTWPWQTVAQALDRPAITELGTQ
jgi:hypothetical protein